MWWPSPLHRPLAHIQFNSLLSRCYFKCIHLTNLKLMFQLSYLIDINAQYMLYVGDLIYLFSHSIKEMTAWVHTKVAVSLRYDCRRYQRRTNMFNYIFLRVTVENESRRKDIADVTHLRIANQLLVVYREVTVTAQRDILVVDHTETHC